MTDELDNKLDILELEKMKQILPDYIHKTLIYNTYKDSVGLLGNRQRTGNM